MCNVCMLEEVVERTDDERDGCAAVHNSIKLPRIMFSAAVEVSI